MGTAKNLLGEFVVPRRFRPGSGHDLRDRAHGFNDSADPVILSKNLVSHRTVGERISEQADLVLFDRRAFLRQ